MNVLVSLPNMVAIIAKDKRALIMNELDHFSKLKIGSSIAICHKEVEVTAVITWIEQANPLVATKVFSFKILSVKS